MGQVAEDMLDGTCCQYCGVWHDDLMNAVHENADETFPVIEWEPQGFPWTCAGCSDPSHVSY